MAKAIELASDPLEIILVATDFSETARLFPRRLRWIAQSDGDMALGVESLEESWVADTPPMLLRFVVVSRTGKQTPCIGGSACNLEFSSAARRGRRKTWAA